MPKEIELKNKPMPAAPDLRQKSQRNVDSIRTALNRINEQDTALVEITQKLYLKMEDTIVSATRLTDSAVALKQSLHEHKIMLSVTSEKTSQLIAAVDRLTEALHAQRNQS